MTDQDKEEIRKIVREELLRVIGEAQMQPVYASGQMPVSVRVVPANEQDYQNVTPLGIGWRNPVSANVKVSPSKTHGDGTV